MRPVIILFAKAPVPGRVKTRLAAVVGPAEAARLHTVFVARVASMLRAFEARVDLELHTDTSTDAFDALRFQQRRQAPGDLGARMLAALDDSLGQGRPQAVILGSDAPSLPPGHVAALLASTAEVALGPAEDGGYWGIACRRTHPAMFRGVEWSTSRALSQTVSAVHAARLTLELGPLWYDIDTVEDLARLDGKKNPAPPSANL